MEEFSMPQSILQIVSEKGFDGLREIMQMLFNEAMKMECNAPRLSREALRRSGQKMKES